MGSDDVAGGGDGGGIGRGKNIGSDRKLECDDEDCASSISLL